MNSDKYEKVIKGLACRLECGCMNEDHCNPECPYLEDPRACYGLDEDALALMKEQEPRVMTPDEVKNAPDKSVVWLELKPDEIFKNEIYPFVGSGTGWYSCYCSANTTPMFTDNDVEQYGIKYRCWTSRPSDAQREETAWDV